MEYILIETLFSILKKTKTMQCFEISVFNLLGAKIGLVRSSIMLSLGKKNNTLVSGNAGDEKNFQPGGPKKEYQFHWIFFKTFILKKIL